MDVKRYGSNGAHIKELRESRERRATQKEFAHEIQISERLLRKVENENAALTADVLERIARALGVHWREIVFSPDGPRPVPPPVGATGSTEPAAKGACELTVVPRFDTDFARVVRDEAELLSQAKDSHVVISHILMTLTPETEAYAEELLDIMESVSWKKRDPLKQIDGRDEIQLRRRLRELLVLLKGNDVWVHATKHFKYLPESYTVQPKRDWSKAQIQAIVAFAPPGEYGEDSIKVPIDHGQPWAYDSKAMLRS